MYTGWFFSVMKGTIAESVYKVVIFMGNVILCIKGYFYLR